MVTLRCGKRNCQLIPIGAMLCLAPTFTPGSVMILVCTWSNWLRDPVKGFGSNYFGVFYKTISHLITLCRLYRVSADYLLGLSAEASPPARAPSSPE